MNDTFTQQIINSGKLRLICLTAMQCPAILPAVPVLQHDGLLLQLRPPRIRPHNRRFPVVSFCLFLWNIDPPCRIWAVATVPYSLCKILKILKVLPEFIHIRPLVLNISLTVRLQNQLAITGQYVAPLFFLYTIY